jgi:amidohydrolase
MSATIDLAAFRRDLHAHPEISGEEKKTAKRVLTVLHELKPDELLTEVGGTGILATFGTDEQGPQVMVRCELDALPIQEVNDFAYTSTSKGVSHKCGHDGHMAMLTGLAEKLSADRPTKGRVHLLYQPAEENGAGAAAVLKDPRMKDRHFDLVLALHNLPGYPLGSAVVRKGAFTASVNSMVIALQGRTSHAAEPENGKNPALAVAELLTGALALQHNVPTEDGLRVVTVVHVNLGSEDYGISAGSAEVHLTVRCWTDAELEKLQQDIEALSRKLAKKHELGVDIRYCFTFKANRNDDAAAELVANAVRSTGRELIARDHPFKWGEDFGLFTAKYKGCMFGLGAGEDMPALHNPDYDFPDALIPHGVELFDTAVRSYLQD